MHLQKKLIRNKKSVIENTSEYNSAMNVLTRRSWWYTSQTSVLHKRSTLLEDVPMVTTLHTAY